LPEAAAGALTVRGAVARGTEQLERAGCDSPRLDAELLLASALGFARERLVLDAEMELSADSSARFEELLARRAAREPVAYILGLKGFRHLELAVDRRVLIPRPETELLVEAALSLPAGSRVADVGTGSGAVALALKDERPDLAVVGVDVSEDAVSVARGNAARLGLDVSFEVGDLLDGRAYDAVVANLPYVAEGAPVAPEISRYEPAGALFAGIDGLDVIRRLVALVAGSGIGFLALEIGFDQADAVSGLVAGAGFGSVTVVRDLAGHDRVVVGRR
jgi:release factor glutamine methyltransferase